MHDSPVDTEAYSGLTEEEVQLLRWRASRYAQRADREITDRTEVVVFVRGDARYAAALGTLREIRQLRTYCPIPGATPVIPGVFHSRGEILPVYDLAGFLDGRRAAVGADWVVVVEHDGERIGLAANEVVGVEPISGGAVRPVPISLGEQSACLQGVLDGGALLLHTPKLFSL
jgi:purine-binding chemotaxis protein CheW